MKVLLPAALRSYSGAAEIELDLGPGATLATLFDALDHRYRGLRFRVVDEQRQLRPNMRLFVNGQGTRDLDQALGEHDFVAVVLALSGG